MNRDDLETLRESWDFEAKAAQGRDGLGELPNDFWPTYSAMANTNGGRVIFGVKERRDHSLQIEGIVDADKVEKQLFDQLANRKKVSENLLTQSHVTRENLDGKTLIVISIPRADRQSRPVYINDDIWNGTYIRLHEGDYRVQDKERIRRMIAESEFDSRDGRILKGYGISDIVPETLRAYRTRFRSYKPDHPWEALEDEAFLRQLGAIRQDRSTKEEGLTVGGLLMFGDWTALREALYYYRVDYQERMVETGAIEWTDRVIPDGTWSGNVYDFYRKVINKLHADLPTPFRLKNDQRVEDTHLHQAVREALVNTLIHADYEGRTGILVLKSRNGFEFRNSGVPRISIEAIRKGGRSDCRNRTLQNMFMLIGLGEQAGSGFSRILRAWREQEWRSLLSENQELELTKLVLSTEHLIPAAAIDALNGRFGRAFQELSPEGKTVLATAFSDGSVDHAGLMQLVDMHSRDLTLLLQKMVRYRMLVQDKPGRGCSYRLPGGASQKARSGQMSLLDNVKRGGIGENESAIGDTGASGGYEHKDQSYEHKDRSYEYKDPNIGTGAVVRMDDDALIQAVANTRRINPEILKKAILGACSFNYQTVQDLATLLNRSPLSLKQRYLPALMKEGLLELKYPNEKTHPHQAYRVVSLVADDKVDHLPSGEDS